MAAPTVFDFAQVKMGGGETPTEVFTLLCGLETTGIQEGVETKKNALRDCATPASPPSTKIRVGAYSWSLNGSGLCNTAQMAALKTAIGKKKNWQIVALDTSDPSVAAGTALGTFAGRAVLTARNINSNAEDFATMELTFEGEGDLVWTAA